MPTFSSLVEKEVAMKTNSGAVSDDKVGIVTTLGFQCNIPWLQMKC